MSVRLPLSALQSLCLLVPFGLSGCMPGSGELDPVIDGDAAVATSWNERTSPCDGETRAMASEWDGSSWAGCDDGGLYHAPEGGDYALVDGTASVDIAAIARGGDGRTYAAGGDGAEPFAVELEGGVWLDLGLDQLLSILDPTDDRFGTAVAVAADGVGEVRLLADGGTSMAHRVNGEWIVVDFPADAEVALDVDADAQGFLAVGHNGAGQAVVMTDALGGMVGDHEVVEIGASGELRAAASGLGERWVAVGADADGGAILTTCESACAETASWTVWTFADADLEAEYRGLSAVSFDATGAYGVAIGERADGSGYALLSTDGGASWTVDAEVFPKLTACAAATDGTWMVSGDAGFYAEGAIDG